MKKHSFLVIKMLFMIPFSYSYPFFPRLDPTLFNSPFSSTASSHNTSQSRSSFQTALVNMTVRTQAEKAKSKTVRN